MSIRHGLLALLRDEPKHGYQLKTEFERATGGMWTVNVGQIYTTLDRLVRDGCVDVTHEDDGDQKQYRITVDGYAELGAWWDTLPREDPPPRDELMVKVLLAIATRPDEALAVITAQRTAVIELLQRRRRDQRATTARGATVAQQLADDALVVRAESDLRWLDLCEARLAAGDRAPFVRQRDWAWVAPDPEAAASDLPEPAPDLPSDPPPAARRPRSGSRPRLRKKDIT